jgi:hypothetical protein
MAVVVAGCETVPQQAPASSQPKPAAATSLADVEKRLIGTWNVTAMGGTNEKLENETKYSFISEGRKCRKKNLFHGYFEELQGTYTLSRKGGKDILLITFDNGYEEKMELSFESESRMRLVYISGKYRYNYTLERVADDIFDIM